MSDSRHRPTVFLPIHLSFSWHKHTHTVFITMKIPLQKGLGYY